MNTYQFRAIPRTFFASPGLPQLTAEAILQTLAGSAVHQLSGTPTSGYDVHLQLDRQAHHDALHDIRVAMEQLGFTVGQAIVTEWLTSTLELAVIGGAGGGALGGATKDPWAMAACAVLGVVAGAVVAQFMRAVKARYDAQLLHPYGPNGWYLTPQQQPITAPSPASSPYSW